MFEESSMKNMHGNHGIVLKNIVTRNCSPNGAAIRIVNVGTFVLIREQLALKEVMFSVVHDMKPEDTTYFCDLIDIRLVPDEIWASLFPIPPNVRLKLTENDINKLIIAVGSPVEVFHNDQCLASGVVVFKNTIKALGVGVFYGLKTTNPPINSLDGIALLKHGSKWCPRDCDIVVTLANIRAKPMEKNCVTPSEPSGNYKTTFVLHMKEKSPNTDTKNVVPKYNLENSESCPLQLGDEVILVDDDRFEKGVVRWTGYLNKKFKVGVEFDNPIGKGSGNLDGKHYFQTKMNHALFVPLESLVKYSDFISGNSKPRNDNINICLNDILSQKYKMVKSNSQHGMLPDGYKTEDYSRRNLIDDNDNNVKRGLHKKQSNSLDAGTSSFIKNVNSINYLQALNIEQQVDKIIDVDDTNVNYKNDLVNFTNDHQDYLRSTVIDSFDQVRQEENFYDVPKPRCEYQTNDVGVSKPRCDYTPSDLGKGSLVEVQYNKEPHYGVIRWIGAIQDQGFIAGVEMEKERTGFTDGTFYNKRYFTCKPRKALFIPLHKCNKDSRFVDDKSKKAVKSNSFGQIDCPVIEGVIPPINKKGDLEDICGKNRGIQGHHNSCYLDATLFAMFAFTSIFDSLLYRPRSETDIVEYDEVQNVLRDEIVNPLRKNFYVRADRVMKLRRLMERLSSVSGLTSEEKDPEEFINSLIAQILRAEPFLKLSSGQETFYYQLFVEKDDKLHFPTVQQLFEQSFLTSDIKLKQVPSCLIIQMPRFGKSYKMYPKILPSQLLDITDIIDNSPRQCTVCGKSAEFECKECFGQIGIGNSLESISFCRTCLERAHNHHSRMKHNFRNLTVPAEFSELQPHCAIPRLYMELFAVVCIETSHYVSFVKCGSGSDAPWCFFDSMADRKGEQNGYNIPEMVSCPNLPYWLSEDGAKTLNEVRDERQMPEHAKRLFCDAYMCLYQSPEMMMYR